MCRTGQPRCVGSSTAGSAVFLFILFLGLPVLAWEIQSFDVDLAVQPDSSVRVTETIRADFQGEPRHGIYRDIPLITQDRMGVRHSIRLTFLGAVDEDAHPWKVEVTNQGAYRRIRLGSSSRTYTGLKTFTISYQVQRIVQSFPDHDELYWNVTGNRWAVPLREVRAAVRLPQAMPSDRLRAAAFTGSYGSRVGDAQIQIKDGEIQCAVNRVLGPFEGLTLAAGWPSGLIRMPSRWRRIGWFLQDNWGFEIPLLVLALMFGIWWRFGRDLPLESIPVRYEPPPGLSPAETGTLVDDRADMNDVTATIVDLARRGHLTIEEQEGKEYLFKRRSGGKDPLKSHESLLLNGLFSDGSEKKLSDLNNHFYKELPEIHAALYGSLMKQRCWWGRPASVRGVWWAAAGGLFFAGWFALASGVLPMVAALWGSAGVVGLFAPFMPKRTPEGTRILEQTLGFREFLKRTDEDRIRRESDPAALFERMLPYALAFGVAGQWAKAFEAIYQIRPTWYTSTGGGTFTPGDFTRRMDRAAARMGTAMTSTPRSSGGSGFGGGFSGGGGGGGGGGSW